MQPFSVHCETCGAKLKVRDPAVVGQIHSCPKCESMVLIAVPASAASFPAAPAAAAPASNVPSDETMAPADFATEIDDLLQQPTPDPEPAAEAASAEVAEPDFTEQQAAEPASEPTASEATAEETVTTAEAAVAGGASRTGFYVWTIAGCVGFFSLGLLAAAWWSRSGDASQNAQVASLADPPAAASESEATADEPAAETVEVNKPAVELESQPEEPSEPAVVEEETQVAALPAVESLPELPPVEENPPAEPEQEQPAPSRVNLAPLDPLAIDSANLDLLLIPDADTEVTADAPIEFEPEEPSDVEEELEVTLPEQKNIRFEPGTASRGPSYAEPLAAGELASRLEMKLPGIAWKSTPLVVAVRELEQLSGVPITVRPADLQMAGVTATHKVSVAKQNATVRELAAELAKQARLQAETAPNGLVLVRASAEKWRDVGAPQYDISDLVQSADQANALAELVQAVVAPQSWQDTKAKLAVEGSSFKVHQQISVHYELLQFLERLRMARGLATKSKYPKAMLTIEPRLVSMKKQLARPTTFAFVDWTPLGDVFDYWHDTTGLAMLPDWQRLADSDLRPLATMAGSVDNVAFSDALDACLAPLDMGWTVVDAGTLQLTTLSAANNTCWVEFYQGADADKLRERIESTVEPQLLRQFVLQANLSGKFVLVYGNRQVHQAAR